MQAGTRSLKSDGQITSVPSTVLAMLVSPRPGVSRDNLVATFRQISSDIQTVHNQHGSVHDRLAAYIEWAARAANTLTYLVSDADVGYLIWTPGYHRLVTGLGIWTDTDQATVRAVNFTVSAELTQRQQAFDAAVADVQAHISKWPDNSARFAVADTSVYIEHQDKLDETLDFEDLLGLKSRNRARPSHCPDHCRGRAGQHEEPRRQPCEMACGLQPGCL